MVQGASSHEPRIELPSDFLKRVQVQAERANLATIPVVRQPSVPTPAASSAQSSGQSRRVNVPIRLPLPVDGLPITTLRQPVAVSVPARLPQCRAEGGEVVWLVGRRPRRPSG